MVAPIGLLAKGIRFIPKIFSRTPSAVKELATESAGSVATNKIKNKPKKKKSLLGKVGAAGAIGTIGYGALDGNDDYEIEDLLTQIRNKIDNGEVVSRAEKRLLRLMEE